MEMEREIDELTIESGFIITTDLRIEFDYYGDGITTIEFGEIWTTWTDYSIKPHVKKDGVRIDNRDDCKLIVKAAVQYILDDISDIHDEWIGMECEECRDIIRRLQTPANQR